MIIAMAGLPGTGKSTLARLLANALGAHLLSKDELRHHLFGPHATYEREQDDWIFTVIAEATRRILAAHPTRVVILDGRTFLRAYQYEELAALATEMAQPLRVLECLCPPWLAKHRICTDLAADNHPAANRTADLYDQIAATADPIPAPKLSIATDRPTADVLHDALHWLGLSPDRSN